MSNFEKTYQLASPIDQVYKAWVSSQTVIAPATLVSMDPRVGGDYRIGFDNDDSVSSVEGEFTAVHPRQRLCYSWKWNDDTLVTTVEINFRESDEGTAVAVCHRGFPENMSRDRHAQGWDHYMTGFAKFCTDLKKEAGS